MSEITKELREYALDVANHDAGIAYAFKCVADRIDAEYRRRMDDCRRETRRALVRYLRGVLTDYDKGIKRVRKGDVTEVVRCKDCQYAWRTDDRFVCTLCRTLRPLGAHLVDADDYCSRGVRKEADE